jgi:diguanylate cyclase (GGDEF)-like protein/PAS domain S-box-containing protein
LDAAVSNDDLSMTLHLELHPTAAALPMLLVAAATLILGASVLARERASAVTLSFFVLTVSVWIWLTGISLMTMAVTAPAAFGLARFAYVGVAMIPAAVLQFTAALTGNTRSRRALLAFAWCGSAAFAGIFLATHAMLAATWRYSWGYYPRLAAASALFLLFLVAVLVYSLVLLGRAKAQTGQERRRNRSFFGALAVGYVAILDFLPAFGVAIYPLGFLPVLGFILLATRAVVRFRLADLTPSFVADLLLETTHGGVLVVDTHGRVRVANDVAAELLGWTREELKDADLRELLGVAVLPATDSDSFARKSRTRNQIAKWRRQDRGEVELILSATALRDAAGEPIGVLYAFSDIADRRRAERNAFDATHDFLTRLPNRSGFAAAFETMKQQVTEAGRIAALFFIDLDGFKAVNDKYGHLVGDALLQFVATRLRNAIRGTDLLARYGGDEFVLLLDIARAEDATLVGNKLIRVISDPYVVDSNRVRISASIGAAFYLRDGETVEALVQAADAAMYNAKRSGKSRLRISRDDVAAPPPFEIDARA